jgi:uncharacterized membrane protein YdbT with pleckstrin-like domain
VAFPRRLLIEGEELILDLRPHPIALARAIIVTVLIALAWALALSRLPDAGHDVLFWTVIVAGIVVFIIWPVRDTVRYLTSHFVVTSDRVIHRQGWIAKNSMEIPLEAINDVRFRQGVFERVIGAGDLIIESAGTRGQEVFEDIREPEHVQKTIYEQGERNQHQMSYGGSSGTSAPSATTELERLADLRARGVLTEEEFQAQKRRILGG